MTNPGKIPEKNEPDKKTQFESLLERNRGRLTGIAHSYETADTEDLLQEMLLQIWRSLGGFRGQSSIDTWCYRVALNVAISWSRRAAQRNNLAAGNASVDQLPASPSGRDSIELLHMFVRSLSDADRAVILMYLDDMTYSQMAEVTGAAEGAIRVRIHRIKRRLENWSASDES